MGRRGLAVETGVTRFSVESPHFPPSRRPGGSSETASGFQHGHSDGMLGSSPRRPTRRLLGTQPHTRVSGPEIFKKPPNRATLPAAIRVSESAKWGRLTGLTVLTPRHGSTHAPPRGPRAQSCDARNAPYPSILYLAPQPYLERRTVSCPGTGEW